MTTNGPLIEQVTDGAFLRRMEQYLPIERLISVGMCVDGNLQIL